MSGRLHRDSKTVCAVHDLHRVGQSGAGNREGPLCGWAGQPSRGVLQLAEAVKAVIASAPGVTLGRLPPLSCAFIASRTE